MCRTSDEIWALTKRNNCHLVKFGTRKVKQWTKNPASLTNMHNSKSTMNDFSVTAATLGKNRMFTVTKVHDAPHGVKKVVRGDVKLTCTTTTMNTKLAVAAINAEVNESPNTKKMALKRLHRSLYAPSSTMNTKLAVAAINAEVN